jgi:hypothetical protein
LKPSTDITQKYIHFGILNGTFNSIASTTIFQPLTQNRPKRAVEPAVFCRTTADQVNDHHMIHEYIEFSAFMDLAFQDFGWGIKNKPGEFVLCAT